MAHLGPFDYPTYFPAAGLPCAASRSDRGGGWHSLAFLLGPLARSAGATCCHNRVARETQSRFEFAEVLLNQFISMRRAAQW